MFKQHVKTAQTPKAAVGQRVIINKLLQHSDSRWRGTNPEDGSRDGFKACGKIIFCTKVLIC